MNIVGDRTYPCLMLPETDKNLYWIKKKIYTQSNDHIINECTYMKNKKYLIFSIYKISYIFYISIYV